MIIVQRIETLWTKYSRGMPNAAARNSVPRALALPCDPDLSGDIYVHEAKAYEDSGFEIFQEVYRIQEERKYWSLSFLDRGEFLEVLFTYNYWDHGRPNRGAYRRSLMNLKIGETGSLHINGRFTTHYGQYYKQNFVNLANLGAPERNVFLDSEPVKYVNKMVHLF